MASLIKLGKINTKYIIYPLTIIMMLIINNCLIYKTKILQKLSRHILIGLINRTIGPCLIFTLYIILKIKNKIYKDNIELVDKKDYKKEYLQKVKKMKPKNI